MRIYFMRGATPILVTAALSIAVLIVATGLTIGTRMQPPPAITLSQGPPPKIPSYVAIEDSDENGIPDWQDELKRVGVPVATSSEDNQASDDPLAFVGADIAGALFGGYLSLKQYDQYTPARGEQLAETVAENIRAPKVYVPHTADELALDDDVSEERILQYRADMRVALEPIVTDEEPEFTLFANYVATGDTEWLDKLRATAKTYREGEANMLKVVVPKDATPEHLRALNAVGEYADTLDRLASFVNDSLATLALIKTYNETERELLLSFDALAKYYVRTVVN